MRCPKCGYVLDDFTIECPRCKHYEHIAPPTPAEPPAREEPALQEAYLQCPGCGRAIGKADAFCAACGYRLTGEAPEATATPEAPAEAPMPRRSRRLMVLGIAFTVLGAACLWGYVIYSQVSAHFSAAPPSAQTNPAVPPPVETTTPPATDPAPKTANPLDASTNVPPIRADLALVEARLTTNEYGNRVIAGSVRNNGAQALSYAHIIFTLSDAQGNRMGSALDNTVNLAPGATWKFSANINNPKATAFKLLELTGG